MWRVARWLTLVALTFSYTVVAVMVAPGKPELPFATAAVWTGALVLSHWWTTRREGRCYGELWSLPMSWWMVSLLAVTVVTVGTAVAQPPPGRSHADLVRITIVAVIGEEALFRGLIWDLVFREVHRTDWATTAVTSALFAIAHVQYTGLTAALAGQLGYTLVAGVVLGWFRMRTGSLLPSVLLHAAGNAVLKLVALG